MAVTVVCTVVGLGVSAVAHALPVEPPPDPICTSPCTTANGAPGCLVNVWQRGYMSVPGVDTRDRLFVVSDSSSFLYSAIRSLPRPEDGQYEENTHAMMFTSNSSNTVGRGYKIQENFPNLAPLQSNSCYDSCGHLLYSCLSALPDAIRYNEWVESSTSFMRGYVSVNVAGTDANTTGAYWLRGIGRAVANSTCSQYLYNSAGVQGNGFTANGSHAYVAFATGWQAVKNMCIYQNGSLGFFQSLLAPLMCGDNSSMNAICDHVANAIINEARLMQNSSNNWWEPAPNTYLPIPVPGANPPRYPDSLMFYNGRAKVQATKVPGTYVQQCVEWL
jgi:hypothetical protein